MRMQDARNGVLGAWLLGSVVLSGCATPRQTLAIDIDPALLQKAPSRARALEGPAGRASLRDVGAFSGTLILDVGALRRTRVGIPLSRRLDAWYGRRLHLDERSDKACLGPKCLAGSSLAAQLSFVEIAFGAEGIVAEALGYEGDDARILSFVEASARTVPDGDARAPEGATLLRVDRTVRASFLPRPGEWLLLPPDALPKATATFRDARLTPSIAPEKTRLAVLSSEAIGPMRALGVDSVLVSVFEEEERTLYATGTITCRSELGAQSVAQLIEERQAEARQSAVVRLLLGAWLSSLRAVVQGRTVRVDARGPTETVLSVVDYAMLSAGLSLPNSEVRAPEAPGPAN